MELDLPPDDPFEDDVVDDDSTAEDEVCAICMEIIIDRGVLDCCSHLFCFTCIDNWAAITNLCPFCKNEFQTITSTPVYSSIGNSGTHPLSFSSDADWSIQENTRSLSFPSYCIDENAVICLDGDGCKVRSGSSTSEENLLLDTSIACDSCDIWYHALCVGFNTEHTSEVSWLCPRCKFQEEPAGLNGSSMPTLENESSTEASLSDKLSVAFADAGETAITVSMFRSSKSEMDEQKIKCNTKNRSTIGSSLLTSSGAAGELDSNAKVASFVPFKASEFSGHVSSSPECKGEVVENKTPTKRDVVGGKRHYSIETGPASLNAPQDKKTDLAIDIAISKRARPGRISIRPPFKYACAMPSSDSRSKIVADCHTTVHDIMSFVGQTTCSTSRSVCTSFSTESDESRMRSDGLGMRKIMHKVAENDSKILKIREEIREIVADNTLRDLGKAGGFDSKLLTAFRAVTAGSVSAVGSSRNPSVRQKMAILPKGKIRENLARKIYRTACSRRNRGWQRDMEIEFWKHRCTRNRTTKLETLNLVLDLLKKSSDSCTSERTKETGEKSISSRLYLADASVFPRKDVKPLSTPLSTDNRSESAPTTISLNVKNESTMGSSMTLQPGPGNGHTVPDLSGQTLMAQGYFSVVSQKSPSAPALMGSKDGKEPVERSSEGSCRNIDKRKWALEVLARKRALEGKDSCNPLRESNIKLKEKFPLLAQLPADMRPKLATVSHSKIPVYFRQAQLFRLTEYALANTELNIMHRTAETELAIADAVNFEKDICERAKSKLVYANLCAQMLLKGPVKYQSDTDVSKVEESSSFEGLHRSVEEALKRAGLVADSPLNSPDGDSGLMIAGCSDAKSGFFDFCALDSTEGDNKSAFNLESYRELDIYGDFEYDLDEKELVFSSNKPACFKLSEVQAEDALKIKKVSSGTSSAYIADPVNPSSQVSDDFVSETVFASEETPYDLPIGGSKATVQSHCCSDTAKQMFPIECNFCTFEGRLSSVMSGDDEVRSPHGLKNDDLCNPVLGGECNIVRAQVSPDKNCLGNHAHSVYPSNKAITRHGRSATQHIPAEAFDLVCAKVEAYIKEHIRPLCKSGVITVKQYRWAVEKTTQKVMKFHFKAKNAEFLIKEGVKVKLLAEQYVEAAKAGG